MTSPILITPDFILDYTRPAEVSDYRCVVNNSGTQVIFERTLHGAQYSQLYIFDLQNGVSPSPFLCGQPVIEISDRPDWCWATDQVAFNFNESIEIALVGPTGENPTALAIPTARMNYPTWFPDGSALAVANFAGDPSPNTTTITLADLAVATDLEGPTLWGGMPSVNPKYPNLIAFAGQLVVQNQKYDQELNMIWVLDTSSTQPPVLLEAQAPKSGQYDPLFQGRAPWWSPDGKWVVFESNRVPQTVTEMGAGLYAIFLYEYGGSNPAIQLTDPAYNCNHAKWFPFGFPGYPAGPFKLIVAAWQPNGPGGRPGPPYGVASLDLTPLGMMP